MLETMTTLVESNARSRVVLPGHSNEKFLLTENADGSLLLEPALVVSAAQYEYDQTPGLRALLHKAAGSGTVRRSRRRRPG